MLERAAIVTTSCRARLAELVDITRSFTERAGDAALLRRTIAERAARLFGGYAVLVLASDEARSWDVVADLAAHPEQAAELWRAMGVSATDGAVWTATAPRPAPSSLVEEPGTRAGGRQPGLTLELILEPLERRGALCVPLRDQQEVIGSLVVGRAGTPAPPFDAAERDLLHVLAAHAAMTVAQARLAAARRREQAEHQRTQEALRLAEDGLLRAAKMEVLGRLAGGVAHDFNNILSVIVGYSEILLDSESVCREDLEEIHRAGLRATSLTKQLLAFSRKEPFAPSSVNMNEVLDGLRPMLHRVLGSQVVLHVSAGAELPACRLDPSQAEQIVMNLVINALDAMPGGGELSLETDRLVLDAADAAAEPGSAAGTYVVLTVRDTGTGMPEEVRRRIFEPFFTTKSKGLGTGLGLTTVQSIVEQSGGSIRVSSEPGRGTTFRLVFPAVASAAPAPDVDALPASGAVRARGPLPEDAAVHSRVCRTPAHAWSGSSAALERAGGAE